MKINQALFAEYLDPINHGDYAKPFILETDAVIVGDKLKKELIRMPAVNEICVIDWLSITMKQDVFKSSKSERAEGIEKENIIIDDISIVLKDIFGFGVEFENRNGKNYYKRSFDLEHKSGYVAIGGQNDTVMIAINGTGCTYGHIGWEKHLYDWLVKFAPNAKITRVDLCHDDLEGAYTSVDYFFKEYTKGGFKTGGRSPNIENKGNWYKPTGKGRTLEIGSRSSGKFCRIYEKGKHLGDKTSDWTRTEMEYKSSGFYIGFGVLLNPSDYFLSAYPCFDVIKTKNNPQTFERKEVTNLITFESMLNNLKKQYGNTISFFRDVYQDDQKLLDILTDIEKKSVPKRLDILTIPNFNDEKEQTNA